MTRKEAKNWLKKLYMRTDITDEYGDMEDMQPYEEVVNMAIKALEQEPFINKPCVSEGACKYYTVYVLDRIREEIMDTGAYEQEINGKTEFLKGINYCLDVINKYTTESDEEK